MVKRLSTLQKELTELEIASGWDTENNELFYHEIITHIIDGVLCVSSDDGQLIVDYYGEFRGSYPYINDKLVTFADDNGMMWEWKDPSTIGLYES